MLETVLRLLLAVHSLQIELKTFSGPLAAMIVIILLTILLYGNIGQMHKHIIDFGNIRRIQLVAKPAEPLIKNPSLQRSIAGDQTVNPQIELFLSNQHGIIHVTGNDPGIVGLEVFEGGVQVGAWHDFLQLVYLF